MVRVGLRTVTDTSPLGLFRVGEKYRLRAGSDGEKYILVSCYEGLSWDFVKKWFQIALSPKFTLDGERINMYAPGDQNRKR